MGCLYWSSLLCRLSSSPSLLEGPSLIPTLPPPTASGLALTVLHAGTGCGPRGPLGLECRALSAGKQELNPVLHQAGPAPPGDLGLAVESALFRNGSTQRLGELRVISL